MKLEIPNLDSCFEQLQGEGWCELFGVLPNKFVSQCQDYVREERNRRGDRYFTVVDVDNVTGSPFNDVLLNRNLLDLITSLVERVVGDGAENKMRHGCNLRVIGGVNSRSQAMNFHYDSAVLTVLMPIMIPDGAPSEAGDLIIFPNKRPFGRSIILNLIQKAFVQNRIYRKYIEKSIYSGRSGATIIKLRPGSLFLFWGYRTLHANFPCRAGEIRATLLCFFGEPHPRDFVMRLITAMRTRREARILRRQTY